MDIRWRRTRFASTITACGRLAEAIVRCEQATVYDNSGLNGPRIVAQLTDGFIVAPHLAGLETAAVNYTLAEVIDRRLRTS